MEAAVDGSPRGWGTPLYERVLDLAAVGPGSRLLDLGCGPGLLSRMAADRGATVTGVDQDPTAVRQAAALVPEGTFDVGDIQLPRYPDAGFDAVACVQSIMHVANPLRVLREAGRVARPGAAVVVTVWGPDERCDVRAFGEALSAVLPRHGRSRTADGGVGPPPLSQDGRLARLAGLAGLAGSTSGEVVCPFRYPDEDTLLGSLLGSGLGQRALRVADPAAVRRAVLDGLADYRRPDGGYQLDNTFCYLVARAPG